MAIVCFSGSEGSLPWQLNRRADNMQVAQKVLRAFQRTLTLPGPSNSSTCGFLSTHGELFSLPSGEAVSMLFLLLLPPEEGSLLPPLFRLCRSLDDRDFRITLPLPPPPPTAASCCLCLRRRSLAEETAAGDGGGWGEKWLQLEVSKTVGVGGRNACS